MNDCLFCKIVAGEIPAKKVYEDNNFLAFLDINPVNLGHTLVVPKQHFVNIFDIPEATASQIGPVIKKLSQAVKDGTQADGVNVIINNETAAGQLIFHAHVHLIPRYLGDGFQHWHGAGGHAKEDFEKIKKAIIVNFT